VTVRLRLFASAREAAGTANDTFEAATVGELLESAYARYGATFTAVVERSKVWVNGEEATRDQPLAAGDEVAVLPPVSGG
jgi:sulfur-carrier protein